MAHALTSIDSETAASGRAGRWAWGVCWLMFASTVLCYLDRQTLVLVRPALEGEFGRFSDETFGWLQAAFLLPYALFQVPAGFLADRGDVRRTYALAVGGWSLAGVAAAFSPTLGALMAFRVLLGLGESFNWPCGLRVTSQILSPSERGLGNGIFNSGAAIGAVVAPLTIPLLAAHYGWRPAFAMVGALGFVWVVAWMTLVARARPVEVKTRPEGPTGRLSATARGAFAGLALISVAIASLAVWRGPDAILVSIAVLMIGFLIVARVLPAGHLAGRRWSSDLAAIVRRRRFWVMVIVAICVNMCWHYLVNWMGSFFQKQRALGMVRGAQVSALPFLAADLGNVAGGWLSRTLASRGRGVFASRLMAMALGAALVAVGMSVGLIPKGQTGPVVAVLMVMAVGSAAVMANYFALCQDVSPRHTGLVVGILGGLGNLFAAGFLPLAGRLQDVTGGYGWSFALVGALPALGVLTLALFWGRVDSSIQAGAGDSA